jgi:L-amino acid N-acyltransferase YncA
MPAAVIRPATAADVAAITAIYAEAVHLGTASFEVDPPDEAEMARRMRALTDGGYPYLVAEHDGTVIGFGYVGPYRVRQAYGSTIEDAVYLAHEARGHGIGGALLRQLIEEAAGRGFRQMIAVVGDSDNAASIRLHKAAGFDVAGTLKDVGYKHGRWLDTVIMQRALGAGNRAAPSR